MEKHEVIFNNNSNKKEIEISIDKNTKKSDLQKKLKKINKKVFQKLQL